MYMQQSQAHHRGKRSQANDNHPDAFF
jgi:hypothetical protein